METTTTTKPKTAAGPACVTCGMRLILGNLCNGCAAATAGKEIAALQLEMTAAVKMITVDWGKPVATIYHIASRLTFVRFGRNHKSERITADQVKEIAHWLGGCIPGCGRINLDGESGWVYNA